MSKLKPGDLVSYPTAVVATGRDSYACGLVMAITERCGHRNSQTLCRVLWAGELHECSYSAEGLEVISEAR